MISTNIRLEKESRSAAYERLLMCLSNFVSLTKTMVVMITINEKPIAEVVRREPVLVLLLIELKIMIRHNTLPIRLKINAILTLLNSSL